MNSGIARPVVLLLAGLFLGVPGFAANSPSKKEVFVFSVPLSGTFLKIGDEEEQRIEFIQGPYVAPRLSGDRSKILLNSRQGGKIGVWIAGEQGSPIAKVVSDFGAAGEGWKMERICDGDQAAWSPDGNRIVFRRGDAIMERELDGGQERIVAPRGRFPSYLADGRIIFVSAGEKVDRISVIGPKGGTPTELAASGEIKSAPKAKGNDRIYLPGEMEWDKREAALKNGLQLPDYALLNLVGLAADTGLSDEFDRIFK